MVQALLNLSDNDTLTNFLNPGDKSAETLVLHIGSHSTKLGLASQLHPFLVPTVIAYPAKKPLFQPPAEEETEEHQISPATLQTVIKDLRHKQLHLIDSASRQQIKDGKVQYKQYTEANALVEYQDGQNICYTDLTKNPYSGCCY